jgi:23S rRNA (pseudouridine1915-N3)-methyltransferase
MNIHLIAIGNRMNTWVNQGFNEYAKRLPSECQLKLIEISAGKRGKNADIARITQQEGERMLAAIPKDSLVIAMDVEGKLWSTEALSREMSQWLPSGQDVCLLVGGPEGLAPACHQIARLSWSLSALTLPHPLVRIVIAEQIYRAWSILKGHPYHR